jgi:two-component system KDP operon response regulator KdpE
VTGSITILVIEDDAQMKRFLRTCLGSNGYRVLEAGSAAEGLAMAASHNLSMILLDLGLPDGDGVDVTRKIRGWSRVPIVVISARGQENDKVIALDAGADDYLTKPFGARELLARIRVELRHAGAAEVADQPIVTIGALRIDLARHDVRIEGKEVHLTPIEFRLLALLARNAGKVLTHRQILLEVWGPSFATQSHYVRVHMAELRKKIEADPARPKLLLTEAGVGYRMLEASPGA